VGVRAMPRTPTYTGPLLAIDLFSMGSSNVYQIIWWNDLFV
jgi:hypothetical protein